MSVSCGNPDTEKDTIMLRRPRFDKSKDCTRCKEKSGNVVIRHAVYCKECFFPLVIIKFRRSLEPSVNPSRDGSRRKTTKAGGNLLLGFSGGLGSTVLLNLVNRTYFSSPEVRNSKGGMHHPRNSSTWPRGTICYVEVCNAFPGVRDRTEQIRAVVTKYDRLDFIPLRIEDAFNRTWWDTVGGKSAENFGVDITKEDLLLSSLPDDSPISRLQNYISSLPTQTAIQSTIQTLTRLLLLYTAASTGSSHLLLGTSLTSLSVSLISSISQGGGFMVQEEAQEEWTPKLSVDRRPKNGQENGAIRVIRPLKEIGMKECAIWAWWSGLDIVGREKLPSGKQSIGLLTKDFIVGLERDYPSTVSTIARTCAKLAPKNEANGICLLCERPAQYGIQNWRSQISIRSFGDASLDIPSRVLEENVSSRPELPALATSLTPLLCYACHTTLTSKSSRGNTMRPHPIPLPMWATSNLKFGSSAHNKILSEGPDPGGEVWSYSRMEDDRMKAVVADFLLDD